MIYWIVVTVIDVIIVGAVSWFSYKVGAAEQRRRATIDRLGDDAITLMRQYGRCAECGRPDCTRDHTATFRALGGDHD